MPREIPATYSCWHNKCTNRVDHPDELCGECLELIAVADTVQHLAQCASCRSLLILQQPPLTPPECNPCQTDNQTEPAAEPAQTS